MKKRWLLILLMLTVMVGSGSLVFAEQSAEETKQAVAAFFQTDQTEDEWEFSYGLLPSLRYNSIEHWRWGGMVMGEYGPNAQQGHMLILNGDYSFYDQSFHGRAFYFYQVNDDLNVYSNVEHDLAYRGIFKDELLWQLEKEAKVGMVYTKKWNISRLETHLIGRYLEMEPQTHPGGYDFASGKELTLHSVLFGIYRGIEGKLDIEYGVPANFTDFDFLRTQVSVSQGFNLTEKDRIKLGGEVGILTGDYPLQEQFFFGSTKFGIAPNFLKRFAPALNNGLEYPYHPLVSVPRIDMMGFREGALTGNRMYIFNLEYQRLINQSQENNENIYFQTFVRVGDVWEGEYDPEAKPKVSIGTGFAFDSRLVNYIIDDGLAGSFTLAYGIGDEAALTFGVEVSMALKFSDLLKQ